MNIAFEQRKNAYEICTAKSRKTSMVDSRAFDLIFLDQHIMNTDLLGSDTAKRLRQKGMSSVLCGLSGDDIASTFIDAGADCFIMKPCPCDKDHLRVELKGVLKSAR